MSQPKKAQSDSGVSNAENTQERITYTMDFKNNSKRLKDELESLKTKNNSLFDLLEDLNKHCLNKYNRTILITMIFRTQEEQDDVYKGTKNSAGVAYNEKPWKSPHQFWHSVDLRSSVFSKVEIKEIEDYLNSKYNSSNYYKWSAKCHDVGLGDHFHIQYVAV